MLRQSDRAFLFTSFKNNNVLIKIFKYLFRYQIISALKFK